MVKLLFEFLCCNFEAHFNLLLEIYENVMLICDDNLLRLKKYRAQFVKYFSKMISCYAEGESLLKEIQETLSFHGKTKFDDSLVSHLIFFNHYFDFIA